MATVEMQVRLPNVPERLTIDVESSKKGMTLPLSAFSEEDLRQVGKDYGEAMLAVRVEQLRANTRGAAASAVEKTGS